MNEISREVELAKSTAAEQHTAGRGRASHDVLCLPTVKPGVPAQFMMKILEFFFHKQAPPVPFVPANEAEYFTRKILGSRMYLDLGRPFSLQGVDVADLWRTAPALDKQVGFGGIRQWHVAVAVTCLVMGGLLTWEMTADPVPGNEHVSTSVGTGQAASQPKPGEFPIQPKNHDLATVPVPSPLPNLSMVASPYPAVGEVMPGGPLPAPMPLAATGRSGVPAENQLRGTPGGESDNQPEKVINRSVLVDEVSNKVRTAGAHDAVELAGQSAVKLVDPVNDKGHRQGQAVATETVPRVAVEAGSVTAVPPHSRLVAFSPDGKSVLVLSTTSRIPVKVGVGEAMPDGRLIESIDPATETVRLAGGVTIKME